VRIIAGSARGTRLRTLESPALRPMLDRVKESLFAILRQVTPGSRVLDLFSGSGALGLEALSRQAQACVFVESEGQLTRLIQQNAERCRLADRCRIVHADVLDLPRRRPESFGLPADLVFCDPPYAIVDDPNARARLFEALEAMIGTWLASDAIVVLHHKPIPHAIWPARRLQQTDARIYGRSQLTFFDVADEAGDA